MTALAHDRRPYSVTTFGCAEWLCRTGRIPGELVYSEIDRRVMIADIKEAVCQHFGVNPIEMTSDRRDREVARPRQVAMYLCKQLTHRSLPEIARKFARHHTTVIHACRQIEKLRASNPEFDHIINIIAEELSRPRIVGEAAR